jgi:lambda repressor-like predicted transcriptional regulator
MTTATVTPITEAPKAATTRRSRASRAADKAAQGSAPAASRAAAKAAPKSNSEPVGKPVITAPKGGTQTVAPRKGAIAKAIKASGSNIMALSRQHGLNPSQMRRLAADSVAKVDLVRAEAIAQALGADLGKLFEAPVDKAAAKAAEPKAE